MSARMKRIVLASRPDGAPTADNFPLRRGPCAHACDGEVLVPHQIHSA